jgi:hypothetical protein
MVYGIYFYTFKCLESQIRQHYIQDTIQVFQIWRVCELLKCIFAIQKQRTDSK